MISTGIVRRVDDLGRVVIPKEIRTRMGIEEGDPLEFYMDKENGLCLKKYIAGNEALAILCAQYVAKAHESISAIMYHDDCVTVVTVDGNSATVKRNPQDSCDFNIAIAYALAKLGYKNRNPVVDNATH